MDRFFNNRAFLNKPFAQWRRPGPITLGVIIWLVAEIFAFSFVVSKLGVAGALLLGLATTLIGFAALKKLSAGAMAHLRQRMERADPQPGNLLDGTLTALGAVFLILPGFITDIAGLALLSPSLRSWLAKMYGGVPIHQRASRRSTASDVIDLEEGDWRQLDDSTRDRRHEV